VFDGNELVAQLFGLPLELDFESFLSVGVSGGPDGFVIFNLIFDHSVKDHCDLKRMLNILGGRKLRAALQAT
jgi:hypothetical protein